MYDLIYEFINEVLINSELASPNLVSVMTDISIVLIYVVLVNLLIWVVNIGKGIFKL